MPLYKRKYNTDTKQYYYKKKKGVYARRTYNKALRLAKFAVSMLNAEQKLKDVTASITPAPAGVLDLLNGMNKGDNINNREGQQIKTMSILFRATININSLATATAVRIMLVVDSQPNGAAFTVANLLENTVQVIQSPINIGNKRRFLVLFNKVLTLSINGRRKAYFNYFKKVMLKTVFNNGNAGDETDITTNTIYFVAFSDESANQPTINYYSRIRFVDN